MSTLEERIRSVQERVRTAAENCGRSADEITLVAATKVQTSDTIREAIRAGIRVCGENRVQELMDHWEDGAYDGAELHFIGRLQTNKVKYIVGKVSLIHSVDSVKLLEEIGKRAGKLGITQDILLEVNIGREESKGGFLPEELPDAVRKAREMAGVRLRGLMAIPPVSTVPGGNCGFFAEMKRLFVDIRTQINDNEGNIDCLSMGMSGDFEDAIRAGATMVRVGTALFGPRPPRKDGPDTAKTNER